MYTADQSLAPRKYLLPPVWLGRVCIYYHTSVTVERDCRAALTWAVVASRDSGKVVCSRNFSTTYIHIYIHTYSIAITKKNVCILSVNGPASYFLPSMCNWWFADRQPDAGCQDRLRTGRSSESNRNLLSMYVCVYIWRAISMYVSIYLCMAISMYVYSKEIRSIWILIRFELYVCMYVWMYGYLCIVDRTSSRKCEWHPMSKGCLECFHRCIRPT